MIVDVNAASLEEMVYKRLEEEILSAAVKEGEALTEKSICERLSVSRTPVRSALHRLAEDGLVSIIPNKGAVVIGVNRNTLIDIYTVRKTLEGLAVTLAAKKLTEENFSELLEAIELSEFYIKKGNTEELKRLDSKFHSIIYGATENSELERILKELHKKVRAYRKLSLSAPGRFEETLKEHREIYEALAARDEKKASSLAVIHVSNALENILENHKK